MPTPLSRYFTLEEMTLSQTAVRHGIDNTPTPEIESHLRALCGAVLDPLRDQIGAPIVVSSGYRSLQVNRLVGGADDSQHVKGEAADIVCPALGQPELFEKVRHSGLPFDQLIDEFGSWVHVSYSPRNRREVLRARKLNGKVEYTKL